MHQALRKDDSLSMSTWVVTINYATDGTTVAQASGCNCAEERSILGLICGLSMVFLRPPSWQNSH